MFCLLRWPLAHLHLSMHYKGAPHRQHTANSIVALIAK